MHLTKKQSSSDPTAAFTLMDLLVTVAVLTIILALILPAMARTKVNSPAAICLNNLRQMASAWMMYSADNGGSLASSYPGVGTPYSYAWCQGNAKASAGSYYYAGTDPAGITNGTLWPYIKSLSTYKCGADRRVASVSGTVKPILRSYSMNCYAAGRSYGDPSGSSFVIDGGSPVQTGVFRVYIKDTEIRYPSKTFVLADEDAMTIGDGMFMVDMGIGLGLIDMPGRQHDSGYGVNFADGHATIMKVVTPEVRLATSAVTSHSNLDYKNLTNMATFTQF